MFRVNEAVCRDGDDGASKLVPADESGLCALGQRFAALGREHGLPYFLVTTFPNADKPGFAPNLLLNNWPGELVALYGASDVFASSVLVSRLKSTIVPVFSADAVFSAVLDDTKGALGDSFRGYGLNATLAFSLHDRALAHYLIAFSGERRAPERAELASIHYDCVELVDSCFGKLVPQDGPREKLSARELECLRWSAAGKSSDEIAIILNISSHTVVSYLKSAMRKLDSVNRMQAVARACRFRLL
ncbi:LuxR C-terminal-related transcriptional regulator [Rhizobium cremeum]|uniref:helix-turn-helix transcriptional regulator n=1 Tax=Rhizobium cremeum TaxID=2813827 RepID=UPI000DE37D20